MKANAGVGRFELGDGLEVMSNLLIGAVGQCKSQADGSVGGASRSHHWQLPVIRGEVVPGGLSVYPRRGTRRNDACAGAGNGSSGERALAADLSPVAVQERQRDGRGAGKLTLDDPLAEVERGSRMDERHLQGGFVAAAERPPGGPDPEPGGT